MTSEAGSQLPGPGAGFTFLYYFSMTIVIVVLIGAQGLHLSIGSVALYRYGILLGLVAGGLGAYFNRTVSFEVGAQDNADFKSQLEGILTELGFSLDQDATTQQEKYSVYRRANLASLLSGQVFVAYGTQTTQVVSRAAILRRLQQKLT